MKQLQMECETNIASTLCNHSKMAARDCEALEYGVIV